MIAIDAGHVRNRAVVCSGDVVVAVGGKCGMLSEIGPALKVGRPVVALEIWDLGGRVVVAASPEEAVEGALGAVQVVD